MLARDQSRIPPGRSIRLTSSAVNGAYFARHAQKSSANCSSESGCAWTAAESVSEISSKSGARTRTHSKSYAKGNSLDVFRAKRFGVRCVLASLSSRAPAAILFSLRASAQGDHLRRETGPQWPSKATHISASCRFASSIWIVNPTCNACRASRSLAQRQLNCAWVLGIVIYLHVASVRVLRCFFGDDSARAIILLPQD